MTQSTLLTRCPHCDTRFRVTDEQLGIAKGKVRCGNCMEVFNANEHQQPTPAEHAPQTVPSTSGPTPDPGASGPDRVSLQSSEEDFVFEDNPDEDAAEGHYAGTKLTFSDDELSDSFRSFDEKTASDFDTGTDSDDTESVDESWAEAMLFDDTPTAQPPRRRPPEPSTPAPDISPEPAQEGPELMGWDEAPADTLESQSRTDEPIAADETQSFAADVEPEPSPEFTAEPWDTGTPYHELGHEPIAVRHNKSRSRVGGTVWTLIVLILLGALVSQVIYFQFDRLSSIPELRPFYEQGCKLAGCELKPLVAIDRIQSRKLVVRTAPDDRNSLIVDAVIVNNAEFEQPFPAIGLTFSNLNGDVVAQSLFAPEDYLAGEAKNLSAMPTSTPIRIEITIRDPGRDAVNYNIAFRSISR